jgi:hypothetical protein
MTTARELTARLGALLREERGAMAEFLLALADFDRRRLWVELGYPSLFSFLRRELGLSAGAAQLRKTAAELLQKLPGIAEPLRDGRLCLSTVCALADVLTTENQGEVLPRFFGLSKREAEGLAAAIQPAAAPRREVVTVVRGAAAPSALRSPARAALPFPPEEDGAPAGTTAGPGSASAPGSPAARPGPREAAPAIVARAEPMVPAAPGFQAARGGEMGSLGEGAVPAAPASPPPAPHALPEGGTGTPAAGAGLAGSSQTPPPPFLLRPVAEPLTADLRRLHLTVSQRVLEKLEAARAALSHARPGATAAEVIEAALDLLLETRAKTKGLVKNPRPPRPYRSNRVPAHVKRTVWTRDGGRCQWPLDSGGVCGSTLRVEVDHVEPRARGGPATAENLRLLCAFHNQLAARIAFGDAWMDRFRRTPPRARGSTAPRPTAPRPTAPRPTAPRPTAPRPTAPRSTAPRSTAPRPTAPRPTAPRSTGPRRQRAQRGLPRDGPWGR